nr:ImmA/IrrE family metallo-endopeptidase [uncultured Devosia sp.]
MAEHYAHLPTLSLPDIANGVGFKSLREEDIEGVAAQLRHHWGIGLKPVPNMITLLESNGIVVATEIMDTTRLDGISTWDASAGRPYMLIADDKQSFARRQFDCAHELGHIVLHRHVSEAELAANFEVIESQANRFASAFLLPGAQFPLDVTDTTMWGLERLKTRWKVSMKAQIMRLRQLEIISSETATRLFKSYSAKGYSKGEPYDDVWPLQKPSLLADIFRALIESGMSKAELARDIVLSPNDVESLSGLPSGWFSLPDVQVFELKRRAQSTVRLQGPSAQVIDITRAVPPGKR